MFAEMMHAYACIVAAAAPIHTSYFIFNLIL